MTVTARDFPGGDLARRVEFPPDMRPASGMSADIPGKVDINLVAVALQGAGVILQKGIRSGPAPAVLIVEENQSARCGVLPEPRGVIAAFPLTLENGYPRLAAFVRRFQAACLPLVGSSA